jgi:porphobilinogen synthase
MKGQKYLSLKDSVKICEKAIDLGIPAIMIFGIIKGKDDDASVALQKYGFHSQIFKKLKNEFGDNLVLISNVCLCDFTKDEFCVYSQNRRVLNEKTAEMLGKIATVHAEAGADVIAPAAMADGQVRHIRRALDNSGFNDVSIMSYIKTNSCLFSPFYKTMSQSEKLRNGIDSSKFRIDTINEKLSMQKAELDINEGADFVIVKPALSNLHLVLRIKQHFPSVPIAAYQVSGEYAMIESAAEKNLLDKETLVFELLNSIKRAGADMILTYHSLEAASIIKAK